MGYAIGRVDIPLQCGFGIVPHSQRVLSVTNVTSDSVQFMDNLKESYNTINCTQRKKSDRSLLEVPQDIHYLQFSTGEFVRSFHYS